MGRDFPLVTVVRPFTAADGEWVIRTDEGVHHIAHFTDLYR